MLLEPTGRSHLCSTCRLRQAVALSVSAAACSLVQRVQSTVTWPGHLATARYNAVRVASEKKSRKATRLVQPSAPQHVAADLGNCFLGQL